ncbi:type I restriction enzyme HsdR N-terminal domain-containing protein [Gracilimonas sp.]|uniref:type I restriction enzyme HsdR N-terminal domain-containing protein n=1 Tax=Gracilimonas sp. TaxID=1974203 RepID=UPI002871F4C4|nr:type I restriction enzyme HsdR N-terminal domain-containing protein [Gracilimonas sp.]
MLSKALAHYPQFRFKEGEKSLWNPILKKSFADLPEERVRLALVDYLMMEAEVSHSRISFESPVKLIGDKSSSRTDLICYDKDFNPLLLAECKAPEIKLDEKAAIQVARYNQKVGAPFVLVSNGMLDFWFEVGEKNIETRNEVPDRFHSKKEPERNLQYWELRSFIGEQLNPKARKFAVTSCKTLYENPHQPVKYLNFDDFSPELALKHYYRIFGLKENLRIALSLSANSYGGTRLNVVLNQAGANTAFCSVSLDLIAQEEPINAEIHSAKGTKEIDVVKEVGFTFQSDITEMVQGICELLTKQS